jgi:hypothetical protein
MHVDVVREDGIAKHVGGVWMKIQARILPLYPRRAKSKGVTSIRCVNRVTGCQVFLEGSKPRSRDSLDRPIRKKMGIPARQTAGGFFCRETGGYLSRGENSEG